MTKQKSTKKTLLTSLLSLVLCMAMLIGTTFAWFTDSVTSGKNRIQAGNLDVAMSYKNTSMSTYEDVEAPTSPDFFRDINGEQILWEPGAVAYANFKVENKGSLALKYNLQTIIAGCNYIDGKSLADVLTVKVVKEQKIYATREAAIDDAKGSTDTLESFAHVNNNMEAKAEDYFTVLLYWEPSSDDNAFNVVNGKTTSDGEALWIDIELSLVATQAVNEEDSFDNQYDKEASFADKWDGTANTAWYTGNATSYKLYTSEELAGLAKLVNEGNDFKGITINLAYNMDLDNKEWTPIGKDGAAFGGTLDGNHYVISNLMISGNSKVGLVGNAGNAASIENITIENATVYGNHYVGTVLGYGYLSANSLAGCFVNNATVVCTPDENNDNGDKAGIIAGVAINGNIYNNKVTNSQIYAYRDFGSIVGMAQAENRDIKVYHNDVDGVEMFYVTCDNYADATKVNSNMGELIGRNNNAGKTVTVADSNVAKNVIKNENPVKVVDNESISKIAKDETVYLAPGTYSDFPAIGENATVVGTNGVVFEDTLSGTLNNTTFKNIDIKAGNAQRWAYSRGTLVFEDCTFEATSVYAIHYDGLNGANITYKNCKIVGWVAIGGGAEHITFDDCEIYGNGRYGLIRLYSPGTIKNCYFDVSAVNTTDAYQDGIHACSCTITVENCVNANGKVEELFNTSGSGIIKLGEVANVTNEGGLNAALSSGEDVSLAGNVATTDELKVTGGTLNGNGAVIDASSYTDNGSSYECGINVQAGTVENVTIKDAFRGLGTGGSGKYEMTGDVTYKNVTVTGSTYGINIGIGNGYKLTVVDSTICDWNSYSGLGEAQFTNCKFTSEGSYYAAQRISANATFTYTNCDFEQNTYYNTNGSDNYYLDSYGNGTIVFNNCRINGVLITSENVSDYFQITENVNVVVSNN